MYRKTKIILKKNIETVSTFIGPFLKPLDFSG